MMTQGTRKQTTEPILGMAILGTNKIQPLSTAVSHAFQFNLWLSSNISGIVFFDLLEDYNQVILEHTITDGHITG